MSLVFTLRVLCDICFYLTFGNFAALLAGGGIGLHPLPLVALVAFGCALLGRWKRLRFLPLILLAGCIYLIPINLVNLLLFLPVCLYTAYAAFRYETYVETVEYSNTFLLFIKIFLPFIIIFGVGMRSQLEESAIPYGLLFLIGSVVLMRMLRHEKEVLQSTKFKILNLISVAAVLLFGFIISVKPILDFFKLLLHTLYFDIIAPILILLMTGLIYLLWPLFKLLELIPESEGEGYAGDIISEMGIFEDTGEWATWNSPWLRYMAMGAVILFFILVIFYIFKRLSQTSIRAKSLEGATQKRYALPKENKKGRKSLSGSINQIRGIYRKFLILLSNYGIDRTPSMTSADYQRIAAKEFSQPEAAKDLRDIYIRSRYGEKPVGGEEIKQMKEQYALLKNSAKVKSS